MELSVVIPVYCSSKGLADLASRLFPVLDGTEMSYEVIFVDDGSTDDSWIELAALQRAHLRRIVAIQLMRNYGQHNALMAGFRHARGSLIVTMDDDLQHPPEEIPKLLDAIRTRDLDLVYGCYDLKRHSAFRNLGSALVNAFYRLVFRSRVRVSSFRVIRRELAQSIFPYRLNFTYIDGLLAWNTQRIGQVAVEHRARPSGRSGYSLGKLVVLALNLAVNFSLLPLQLVSALGFLTAAGGLFVALYYFIQYMRSNITVPGYASTIIAILVLGGIQLIGLGIIGEYLGRLHLNVNRKPQYVERQILARDDDRKAPSARAAENDAPSANEPPQ